MQIFHAKTCGVTSSLQVHKNENFFGFDFKFCIVLLLVMLKYKGYVTKIFIGPLWGEVGLFRVVLRLRGIKNCFKPWPKIYSA
jgi:hypothetical protein